MHHFKPELRGIDSVQRAEAIPHVFSLQISQNREFLRFSPLERKPPRRWGAGYYGEVTLGFFHQNWQKPVDPEESCSEIDWFNSMDIGSKNGTIIQHFWGSRWLSFLTFWSAPRLSRLTLEEPGSLFLKEKNATFWFDSGTKSASRCYTTLTPHSTEKMRLGKRRVPLF